MIKFIWLISVIVTVLYNTPNLDMVLLIPADYAELSESDEGDTEYKAPTRGKKKKTPAKRGRRKTSGYSNFSSVYVLLLNSYM